MCIPTVFLWLLFIYVEASIRLKEFKASVDIRNMPFHLDLCRPFAAHWLVVLLFQYRPMTEFIKRIVDSKQLVLSFSA